MYVCMYTYLCLHTIILECIDLLIFLLLISFHPLKVRDIANGMCYLHTFPVLHRNLQPRNVLLGENLNAKLSDFGFYETKVQSNYYVHLRKQCKGKNTKKPLYLAPEVIERNEYSIASDVYAFGKCICIAEHIVYTCSMMVTSSL